MTSRDLSGQQVEKIAAAVGKRAAYFYALSGRCHQKCFPRDDALRVAGDKVDAAVRELAAVVEGMRGRYTQLAVERRVCAGAGRAPRRRTLNGDPTDEPS